MQIFTGTTIHYEAVTIYFEEYLVARYFRIIPVTFSSYKAIRMELLTPTDLASDFGRSLPTGAVCVFEKSLVPTTSNPCGMCTICKLDLNVPLVYLIGK